MQMNIVVLIINYCLLYYAYINSQWTHKNVKQVITNRQGFGKFELDFY